MYSEELENLIDLALADGEITEKEKAVLFKKAQALGIDKDEFEMVLEGKLQLRNQRETQKKETVMKCPSCNEIMPPLTNVCPACGFLLNANINTSEERSLDQLIQNIERCLRSLKGLPNQSIKEIIGSFLSGKRNEYSQLKAEAESYRRSAKTLYGENKKVHSLLEDLNEEFIKVDRKRGISLRNTILIFISFIIIVFSSILLILKNIETDSSLMRKVNLYISNNDFKKAEDYASKMKNITTVTIGNMNTRQCALRAIQNAQIKKYVLKNKLDSALNIYNPPSAYVAEFGGNYAEESENILITKLIEVNRMEEAEKFFSNYYNATYHNGEEDNYTYYWKMPFLKIYNGYIENKNKQGAKVFVLKYARDVDRQELLKNINVSLQ